MSFSDKGGFHLSDFKKAFSKVQKDIQAAQKRAANRALNSTRAQYAKVVSAELGIPSKTVRGRSRITRPGSDINKALLEIGTKILMTASTFKPKETHVKGRLGKRWAASYQVGRAERIKTDRGFIIDVNNKKVVVQRSTTAVDAPLQSVYVDVFRKAVEQHQASLGKTLRDSFEKNFVSELNFQRNK
jgi:hypothetical protein